jgi:hypothetical protein
MTLVRLLPNLYVDDRKNTLPLSGDDEDATYAKEGEYPAASQQRQPPRTLSND